MPAPGQGPVRWLRFRSARRRWAYLRTGEVEAVPADKNIGPLDGFRSKAGWPFTAEIVLKFDEDDKNWKLEFDFGDEKADGRTGELVDFVPGAGAPAPSVAAAVHEHGSNYVCEQALCPRHAQPTPSCDFKSGQIILQQPVARADASCWPPARPTCSTKFVSMRTRAPPSRPHLAWDAGRERSTLNLPPVQVPAAQDSGYNQAKNRSIHGASAEKGAAKLQPRRPPQKGGRPKPPPQATGDRRRCQAQCCIGRRDRRRAGVAHRGHEEAVGLHQGSEPAEDPRTSAPSWPTPRLKRGVRQGPWACSNWLASWVSTWGDGLGCGAFCANEGARRAGTQEKNAPAAQTAGSPGSANCLSMWGTSARLRARNGWSVQATGATVVLNGQ